MSTPAPGTLIVSDLACVVHTHSAPPESGCTYQVAWAINPHMQVGAVNAEQARDEHARFVATLRRLGATVEVLPFVHGALDCVFAKDNAVLVHDLEARALVGRALHEERRGEQVERAIALAALGFEIHLVSDVALEGGDVVRLPDGGALLGCGPRSSARAADCLSHFLDAEVIALPLRDPHLYHLDTALALLRDGTAFVCKEAFETSALATLDRLVARGVLTRIVRVPYEEALQFAVNVIEVGDAIVTGTSGIEAPITHAAMTASGKRVISVPLGQFRLAGGSAACLVARVDGPSAHAVETALGDAPRPSIAA